MEVSAFRPPEARVGYSDAIVDAVTESKKTKPKHAALCVASGTARFCVSCYVAIVRDFNVLSCRPLHYYALDDMWESEHNYDHVYPEEIGMDAAEAEQAALANGLTFAGEAPDGTPLYYASDGTGTRGIASRFI